MEEDSTSDLDERDLASGSGLLAQTFNKSEVDDFGKESIV